MKLASPAQPSPNDTPGSHAKNAPGCRKSVFPLSSIDSMSPGNPCVRTSSAGTVEENSFTKSDSPPKIRFTMAPNTPPLQRVRISTVALMLAIASASAMIRSPGCNRTRILANDGRFRVMASISGPLQREVGQPVK